MYLRKDLASVNGMELDLGELFVIQLAVLVDDAVVHAYLAYVVQQRGEIDLLALLVGLHFKSPSIIS